MPQVILVAGPNGTGKTSFAKEFLPIQRRAFVYFNADEIERETDDVKASIIQNELRAGRTMLTRLDDAIASRNHVMLETTLATRIYIRRIQSGETADIPSISFTSGCRMSSKPSFAWLVASQLVDIISQKP